MSDKAPYEVTLTFPVWQWSHANAMEWVTDLTKKLERINVIANGGGLMCPAPIVTTLRKNERTLQG